MSKLNLEQTTSTAPETKRIKMKQFIEAVREYLPTKAENIAILMNRLLQALSVTIDLSVFDPHSSIVAEFFVSLHELMSNLEQRSNIAWNCVEVLSNACRNPAARLALIHTYQFLPPLSRLLGDQITTEKKIRLLTLMQELTCGIKISWQIPHLPHLMSTLTKWVECKEEQIVALSLGVLVNLCYKNLPAVYTLSRCVDIKKLMRTCMPLQGITIEVHVCKLLIILDYLNGKVPEASYFKLIDITFKSVIEAYKASDSILLRHSVEFFIDVLKQDQAQKIIKYENYNNQVDGLLMAIENNTGPCAGDAGPNQDPECMSLIFDFLYTLIDLHLLKWKSLHFRIMQIALKWIETDIACTQALSILRSVATTTAKDDNSMLEHLVTGLPVFLMSLTFESEDSARGLEHSRRTGALLQLLRTLTQAPYSRQKILDDLKEEMVEKIFAPLLSTSPRLGGCDTDTCSPEAINLYVFAIGLVDELAKHDPKWITLYTNLMAQKQVHMILAQALYSSTRDVKTIVLSLAGAENFPTENMALALADMQPSVHLEKPSASGDHAMANSLCFPVMSVAKIERLEEVISELKEALAQKDGLNISTSSVMELYEYKLAAMGHAERAAMASVDAASQRCTHLEHRTAQLTAELSRLHQLLFHTQQLHEEATKSHESLTENNKLLEGRLMAEKAKVKMCMNQVRQKEMALEESKHKLEDASKELNEMTSKQNELLNCVAKLEENLLKKEKLAERKDEQLNRMMANVATLKSQNTELESLLDRTEKSLIAKTREADNLLVELEQKRNILNTITEVARS